MKRDLEDIKHDLSHVYWIGGTSRGGKSTVAKAIEKEFGFSVYVHDRKWVDGDHTLRVPISRTHRYSNSTRGKSKMRLD